MITAAMHRARSILTAARTEIAQIADQDDAIPWTLLDVDRVITDLTNQIEAEETHREWPRSLIYQ